MRSRGATKRRIFLDARFQSESLYQSYYQLCNERTRRYPALSQKSFGTTAASSIAYTCKRTFATHTDIQPPEQEDPLNLFRPRPQPQGKVDIKTRLKAWQQEYDKSDEAIRPYISNLGGSVPIRAKVNTSIDVVRSPRQQVTEEEDEDFEDISGLESSAMQGTEAGFLSKGDLVEL